MSSAKRVACLAGNGVGPELMAAATRALDAVGRLHGVGVRDLHFAFAGGAMSAYGHPLPASTREGYKHADAILVASPDEPALDGVLADLELACRVTRIHVSADEDLLFFGPVAEWANETALGRAFACAASRRGRVLCIGDSPAWRDAAEAEHERWAGMTFELATLGQAIVALREHPEEIDVVVSESPLHSGLVEATVHFAHAQATVAHAWLPERGPGVFAPGRTDSDDVAGFGVADPAGVLLTASLLLGEGLDSRAAARTLERAVGEVVERGGDALRDSRRFTDEVLELLPQARTDLELFEGARR